MSKLHESNKGIDFRNPAELEQTERDLESVRFGLVVRLAICVVCYIVMSIRAEDEVRAYLMLVRVRRIALACHTHTRTRRNYPVMDDGWKYPVMDDRWMTDCENCGLTRELRAASYISETSHYSRY